MKENGKEQEIKGKEVGDETELNSAWREERRKAEQARNREWR